MIKSNVSVFIEVYNEENRIEPCLKSFQWADDLIVFDKNSTDLTKTISLKYSTKVIDVPFTDASENIINNISNCNSKEWVCFPTASSLMHPNLADEIIKLTTRNDFDFDVIAVPYAMYSFGIESKFSPWSSQYKFFIIRRSCLVLSTMLHYEYTFSSKRIFFLKMKDKEAVLYHLTHDDASNFFNRVIRYTNYESNYLFENDKTYTLNKSFLEILKSVLIIFFKKKPFVLGWNGLALSLAFISYYIMKFIFTWDKKRKNGNNIYPIIRKNISALWDKNNKDIKLR